MENDYGYVQDVVADLESGTITSIMAKRQKIDIITQDIQKKQYQICRRQELHKFYI